MTFFINIGRWGGIYFRKGYCIRICLGWIAFTFAPVDIDDILSSFLVRRDRRVVDQGEKTEDTPNLIFDYQMIKAGRTSWHGSALIDSSERSRDEYFLEYVSDGVTYIRFVDAETYQTVMKYPQFCHGHEKAHD